MYHSHFGLLEEPFGVSPDGRFFFETEQHHEALATLYYAVRQRRGFALLTSRAGLGKTSLVVQLLRLLEEQAEVAFLPHPYFDHATVLESILSALGLTPSTSPSQNHRLFYEFLMDVHKAGRTCVLVFDEAQEMSRATLEAIRMLSNFETPREKLLQVVLVGQPRLAKLLRMPECVQIRQRINLIAHLKPLSAGEVHEYVAHRLNSAGTSVNPFAREAVDAIAAASGGVPRNVNTICFNCLTLAYALKRQEVGSAEVAEVLRDLDLNLLASDGGDHPAHSPISDSTLATWEDEEFISRQ